MDLMSALKQTELFRGMTDEELTRISSLCEQRQFAKGDRIMDEGEVGTEFFVIPQGLVGIDFKVGEGVYIQRAHHAANGDIFGELSIFGHKRSARVNALEDVTLLAIPIEGLRATMRELPRVGYQLMTNLARILAERLMTSNITLREMAGGAGRA